MSVILDSQIINWYYVESVKLELEPNDSRGDQLCQKRTGCAVDVLVLISQDNPVVVDNEGHIHQDWKDTLGNEWFSSWYSKWLARGLIVLKQIESYSSMCEELRKKGFPLRGRDKWYVRTAKTVSSEDGKATIVTEDMDFHHPAKKRTEHKEREKILRKGTGPMAKYLEKNEGICVRCISRYLSDAQGED